MEAYVVHPPDFHRLFHRSLWSKAVACWGINILEESNSSISN
jgi:hypothetical protein